jgi:hypothetical protein
MSPEHWDVYFACLNKYFNLQKTPKKLEPHFEMFNSFFRGRNVAVNEEL